MTFANTGTLTTRVHSLFLLSHSLKYKDILGYLTGRRRSSVARLSPYTVHHLSWHRSGYPKCGTPVTEGETAEVRAVVQQWLGRNAAKWQDRESLGGLLQHAVKVSGTFWLCTAHYTTDGISQEQISLH